MKQFLYIIFAAVPLMAQTTKDSFLSLQQKWNLARQKALAPITATYIRELEALVKEETRKGNLAQALRAQTEIDKIKADIDLASDINFTSDQLRDALRDSMWTGVSGVINGWTLQLRSGDQRLPGSVQLIKPDGSNGWGGWSWIVDDKGDLLLTIPGQAKPVKTSVSKKFDRIELNWGNATISRMTK